MATSASLKLPAWLRQWRAEHNSTMVTASAACSMQKEWSLLGKYSVTDSTVYSVPYAPCNNLRINFQSVKRLLLLKNFMMMMMMTTTTMMMRVMTTPFPLPWPFLSHASLFPLLRGAVHLPAADVQYFVMFCLKNSRSDENAYRRVTIKAGGWADQDAGITCSVRASWPARVMDTLVLRLLRYRQCLSWEICLKMRLYHQQRCGVGVGVPSRSPGFWKTSTPGTYYSLSLPVHWV